MTVSFSTLLNFVSHFMEEKTSQSPLVKVKSFYNRLPNAEHTPATKKIIDDLPQNTLTDIAWSWKQVRLLVLSLRETENIEDAYTLFFKMFDRGDCRTVALRFYYVRWLLFAIQKDAYKPPFRTVDENFVFAKVAMLMRDKDISDSLK
jgi:hypothetical protein